jgi:hypothetical protein
VSTTDELCEKACQQLFLKQAVGKNLRLGRLDQGDIVTKRLTTEEAATSDCAKATAARAGRITNE